MPSHNPNRRSFISTVIAGGAALPLLGTEEVPAEVVRHT
jgi:hypothetical protein